MPSGDWKQFRAITLPTTCCYLIKTFQLIILCLGWEWGWGRHHTVHGGGCHFLPYTLNVWWGANKAAGGGLMNGRVNWEALRALMRTHHWPDCLSYSLTSSLTLGWSNTSNPIDIPPTFFKTHPYNRLTVNIEIWAIFCSGNCAGKSCITRQNRPKYWEILRRFLPVRDTWYSTGGLNNGIMFLPVCAFVLLGHK